MNPRLLTFPLLLFPSFLLTSSILYERVHEFCPAPRFFLRDNSHGCSSIPPIQNQPALILAQVDHIAYDFLLVLLFRSLFLLTDIINRALKAFDFDMMLLCIIP